MDREKVVKGLECCSQPKKENCMQCPYRYPMYPSGDREDWLRSCQELYKDTLALLKEQEAVEHKTGHWIFESRYLEAWSHTCSECGKRMTTAVNTFANFCWNCGTKMEEQRQESR